MGEPGDKYKRDKVDAPQGTPAEDAARVAAAGAPERFEKQAQKTKH